MHKSNFVEHKPMLWCLWVHKIDWFFAGFRGAPYFVSSSDCSNGYNGESEKMGYQAQRSPSAYGSSGGSGNGAGGGFGGACLTVGTTPERGGCDSFAPVAPSTVGTDALWISVYLGGSGSASGSHYGSGRDGSAGGASGGIIFISARDGITNNGGISSNGVAGQNGYASGCYNQSMGGGGGGAGGTIWLQTVSAGYSGNTAVASGGAGGSRFAGTDCVPGGFGGSGGAGRIVSLFRPTKLYSPAATFDDD